MSPSTVPQKPHRTIRITWTLLQPLPRLTSPPRVVLTHIGAVDIADLCELALTAYRGPWDWWLDRVGIASARRQFAHQLTQLPTESSALFTAREDGALAGSIVATTQPDAHGDHIAVYGLVVHPDYRGRGLGKELLLHALAWLQSKGLETAQVTTTAYPDRYPPAIHVYLHYGGRITGET